MFSLVNLFVPQLSEKCYSSVKAKIAAYLSQTFFSLASFDQIFKPDFEIHLEC